MDTKDVILELRTKKGLSQDELAEKLYVTRQAVSRWENGETIPNTETLKLLSKFFDVSINMILSRLVDTFFSRISLTMQPPPKPHSTACVLPWEEGRHWQSRSSGCSSS